jgi:hypothetical protein
MDAKDTPRTDSNSGNDGFVWSRRLTVFAGILLAVSLAIAQSAHLLAAPLEWLP